VYIFQVKSYSVVILCKLIILMLYNAVCVLLELFSSEMVHCLDKIMCDFSGIDCCTSCGRIKGLLFGGP